MENILKMVKSLEDSGILLKGVSETIKHEAKEQKGRFVSKLLATLGVSLLGNMLAGKGVTRAAYGSKRPSLKKMLMTPPHPLTNFEIQTYYQNEPRFNGVYSKDSLPNKLKDEAYPINLDEYLILELIG